MTAQAAVLAESHAVLQQHARSFSWAAAFLSPEQADDAAVVYHFCRLVDDTVDEATSHAAARRGIGRLRAELTHLVPPSPVVAAFLDTAADAAVGRDAALELVEGCRSDLEPTRVADDRELLRYSYRVAGTVGLMMCGVLGVTDRAARAHAIDLGIAMQLTNICRDVQEDAWRGRVYLPASRLRAHGADSQLVLAGAPEARPAVIAVTRELLTLADRYYASGRAGLRHLPWRARLAIAVASRIYRAIGVRLRRRGGDPLQGRTVVPAWGKVLQIGAACLDVLRPGVLGLTPRPEHDGRLHEHLDGLPAVG